jgi:hypothetical protein
MTFDQPSSECFIKGFSGFSVEFSPFYQDTAIVVGGENFGIQGRGLGYELKANIQKEMFSQVSFV